MTKTNQTNWFIFISSRILLYTVFGLFVVAAFLLVGLSYIQKKFPNKLPQNLRTWEFLPNRVYDALCFVSESSNTLAPSSSDIYVDVEKNVINGDLKEQPMKVGMNNGRVGPLATENMYASVKSFNMNPTVVEDINEENNEDFDQHMKF